MKKILLLCNAHLDPVWQWEWDEGAAAALSTFRAAADFCDEFEGFIFNHNEVILYQWIEEYEPVLFERIKKHVASGKWHIMGGWYLQPDCNMPSGESFVRQILAGRTYFKEKFGVKPQTAVNFDSFGHARGLVQILRKSGYDSYILTRPNCPDYPVKYGDFTWVGYDNSEITVHKIYNGYGTSLGKAHEKIEAYIGENPDKELSLLLWGVGNHGGGPSRIDLNAIDKLNKALKGYEILHSTPEAYFQELSKIEPALPRVDTSLNPCFIGCYTSQITVKQKHRQLESQLFLTERMVTAANTCGLMQYAAAELTDAQKDLLMAEFHDILPGTSIQPAEENALRLLDHGLEILSRLKTRAFFALAAGQEKAKEGEYPLLVYNPHPYKVKGIFECEFMLADQNWKDEFSAPVVLSKGHRIPAQPEKELSNIHLDWRKRVVFEAELEPFQMNRFDCLIEILPQKPAPVLTEDNGYIRFKNSALEVDINCNTGLIDRYRINGEDYLGSNAFLPLVMKDNADPWGMGIDRFETLEGSFSLMDHQNGAWYSGIEEGYPGSVRVIEDGEVRSVVEAVLNYNQSQICLIYKLPKKGTEIEVQIRVHWNEKNKMLKLSIPTTDKDSAYLGQTAYGTENLRVDGSEVVSQQWCGTISHKSNRALTIINNGIYGSSFQNGEIRLTLLRSPCYCAHPIPDRALIPNDRFLPRIDQGERLYSFWINGGTVSDRMNTIDREALVRNEKPHALSFFPSGEGSETGSFVLFEGETVMMTAMKRSEDGHGLIFRLFNPSHEAKTIRMTLPPRNISENISFECYEIKTLRLEDNSCKLTEVQLTEEA